MQTGTVLYFDFGLRTPLVRHLQLATVRKIAALGFGRRSMANGLEMLKMKIDPAMYMKTNDDGQNVYVKKRIFCISYAERTVICRNQSISLVAENGGSNAMQGDEDSTPSRFIGLSVHRPIGSSHRSSHTQIVFK
jgi:hypothetical protein